MSNKDAEQATNIKPSLSISSKISSIFMPDTKMIQLIPIGEDYRRNVQHEIVNFLKEGMMKFRQLSSIEADTKTKLFPIVRSHLKKVSIFEGAKNVYLKSTGLFSYMLSFLVASIILPFLTPKILRLSIPLATILLYLIPCYFISGYIITRAHRLNRFMAYALNKTIPSINIYFISIVSIMFIQTVIVYYLALTPNDLFVYLISTPLLINALGLLLYVLALVFAVLILAFWSMRRFKKFPISHITYEHLLALNLTINDSLNIQGVDLRKRVAEHLLSAARYTSFYLSEFLKIKDNDINTWSDAFVNEISSGLRNMAKSAIKSANNEELQNQIAKNLVAIATSNFADCLTAQPETISPKEKQQILAGKIKTLIIGIIPLLAFYPLQKLNLITNSSLLDYAFLGSWIWLILNIIAIIDPALSERIKSLKDIVGLIPPK